MAAEFMDLRQEIDSSTRFALDAEDAASAIASTVQNSSSLLSLALAEASTASCNSPTKPLNKFLIRTLPKECNPTPLASSSLALSRSPLYKSIRKSQNAITDDESRPPNHLEPSEVAENPFDDLTPERLLRLTGQSMLTKVTSLEISVNSNKQSIEVIGEWLPALVELRLVESSVLHSFRDLGTSLRGLQVLRVQDCGIKDLDGINALPSLHELYLAQNHINDITPLTMHEELQVIDLQDNCIADAGQLEQLAFCVQLASLNLAGNVVCQLDNYRNILANLIPQLVLLDGQQISLVERRKLADEVIDASIRKLQQQHQPQLQQQSQETRTTDHDGDADSSIPGGSSPSRDLYQDTMATSSSLHFIGFDSLSSETGLRDDYASSLTHGTDIVFAGNVTSALRRRRSEGQQQQQQQQQDQQAHGSSSSPSKTLHSSSSRVSITATLDRAKEIERNAIIQELKAWRLETSASPSFDTNHSNSSYSHPNSSSRSPSKAERRPATSAGELHRRRREAFVDDDPLDQHPQQTRQRQPKKSPVPQTARESGTSSRKKQVDVLILEEDDARKKSSLLVTDTSDLNDDFKMEILSSIQPLGGLKTSRLPTTNEVSTSSEEEDDDQDEEDEYFRRKRKLKTQLNRSKPATAATACPGDGPTSPERNKTVRTFFDVEKSLHAIDRWQQQQEAQDSSISPSKKC